MSATPWAVYTPRMILDSLGFAVFLFLVLFGLTLICVGGFFCSRILREYFRAKPLAAFEKRAAAAIQSADLGWLAIVCGPLLGVFIFLPAVPISLLLEPLPESLFEIPKMLVLMAGVGAVAGVIAAGAFWVTSSLLGNVRKARKRLSGVRDPEFDGLF
jgi:hypothetical protein